ncbi:MAG TPA: VOC family protein [Stellaceae bacterium]|nr:VOC family protein [Stellaceae bacterium]
MLPAPGFHHLHLNSVDPDAAIAWYTRQFPSTARGEWGGHKALKCDNNVLILFDKVDKPAPQRPQSAIWHFGWHVTDSRRTVEEWKSRPEVTSAPLYREEAGEGVAISSDTWPSIGNTLGLTKAQIADAKAKHFEPTRVGGFAYFVGPDDALFEIAGNHDQERFNHVHMWQDDVFCALIWYQKHLNAPLRPGYDGTDLTEDNCTVPRHPDRTWPALNPEGMFRTPRAGVEFGDVSMMWYANQGDRPLVSPLGQLQDHIGLSVGDLDAWVDKLKGERVKFLNAPYKLGDTRAVMIEGPSKEALELVEVK